MNHPDKKQLVRSISFGNRVAEEELNDLEKYFVATDQWNQVYSGVADVVYGPKGSGKSALYALITKRQGELFDRCILVRNAENPRGATAFSDIASDPPPTEKSFIALWKLYLIVLVGDAVRDFGINNPSARALVSALEDSGLLAKNETTISKMFCAVKAQILSWFAADVESVEWTIGIEPSTGMPVATRKASYRKNQSTTAEQKVNIPLDELAAQANKALDAAGISVWVVFDRLDVAFNDTPEVERNALRALFRVYNDFKAYDRISLKIFVRDDIWERITDGGFAEASHITKTVRITWSADGLLNLLVRRLLNNDDVVSYLGVDKAEINASFELQKAIAGRVLPKKIDSGKTPETIGWMINHVQDGTRRPAPREFIHLLEAARLEQVEKIERGESLPADELLFDKSAFKKGLDEVSDVRYNQTFLAENDSLKVYTEALRKQKTRQSIGTLSALWGVSHGEALQVAERLVKAGFFVVEEKHGLQTYWIPFIYKAALELVQGAAFDTSVAAVESNVDQKIPEDEDGF